MSKPNRVTGIMMAAANMEADRIYDDINARARWPYKAEAPEYGLDLTRIYAEALQARKVALRKDLIAFAVTFVGLFHIALMVLAFIALAVLHLVFRLGARQRARQVLSQVEEAPPEAPARSQRSNLLVSGGYLPFLGCGNQVRAWSFTVDLSKPADESLPPGPLTAKQLYAETQTTIESLRLPGVQFFDVLCVDGRDVGQIKPLLPGGRHSRPVSRVPAGEIDKVIGANDSRLRHYRNVQIDLWGGQMVVNIFYRYMIQANLLYAEARFYVLTPLKQEFLDYERMPLQEGLRDLAKEVGLSIVLAPFLWVPAVLRLNKFLSAGLSELLNDPQTANRKAIDRDRRFNYGWAMSLREQWAGGVYERYFQGADMDLYEKAIKDALLEGMLSSFKARNISTDAFEQASTQIFNEGIIVSGGSVQAESISAGKGARAAVQKMFTGGRESAQTTAKTS